MKRTGLFSLLALMLLTFGCVSPPPPAATNTATTEPTAVVESRLRPGDQLQIRIETSTAQPAQSFDLVLDDKGELTLPLIDRVQAGGLSTDELDDRIRAAYVPRYYTRCNVIVLVASRFFYVDGEVRSPGRHPWTKDVTLMKAINIAGGFNDFAKRAQVQLTRGKDKRAYNADDLRQHPEKDVPIQPGDSIYVPRSIW
jgi:polysaccharide export outer membrane protein